MKMEAVKNWWKEHEDLKTFICVLGGLAMSYYLGCKLTSLKIDSGLRIVEREGYLKFFNPETGQQLTPSEFCQLEIK